MAVGTKDLMPEQLRGLDDTRLADELKKAKEEPKDKRVDAIEKFLKDYPNSTVEADARAGHGDLSHQRSGSRPIGSHA